MGAIGEHFVNGNLRKRLIQQIQQKYVPECTSLFPTWRQRSKVALNALSFMEERQRCECLYNKFSKVTNPNKLEITSGKLWEVQREVQNYRGRSGKKYKSIRSSYGQ